MTTIRENGGFVLASFGYDDLGRRTSMSRGNGTTTTYGYDGASQLTGLGQDLAGSAQDLDLGFGYDGRGNLIASDGTAYGYTVDNQLATSPGANLAYDPVGRLFNVTSDNGVNTTFVYDGAQVTAEIDQGNPGGLLRRYVYGPGADEPLLWYEGTGTGDRRYLAADERGSIVAVTDDAGNALAINRYDEFGIPQPGNLGRFQYTGQKWLPSLGLYDYKARMYSATLGRFMQTDPIGYGDGMNWYDYVGGDPVNRIDPLGLAEYCFEDRPASTGTANDFTVTAARTVCVNMPDGSGGGGDPAPGGGGGGMSYTAPLMPQRVDCGTRLPNGKTVGDYVRDQRAALQGMADATMQSESGPLPAATGAMAAIAWPNGPIDFKNNFRGQGDAGTLGRAGNFAYYAIGTGIIPNAMLDAGAGAYAITSALRGHKSWSTLTGPMFSDQSAASVRDAALASGGCPK